MSPNKYMSIDFNTFDGIHNKHSTYRVVDFNHWYESYNN